MSIYYSHLEEENRLSVVLPKQGSLKVVGVSNPVISVNQTDEKYEERVRPIIDRINEQYEILERDKNSLALEIHEQMKKGATYQYGGDRVFSFHSLGGIHNQETLQLFKEFSKAGSFIALDIETVGDSHDRNSPYGITEIAMNEYSKDGKLKRKMINTVVQQDKDVLDSLQKTIDSIKSDKYKYNQLPDWLKRSVVDLMRYSTYVEGDDLAFSSEKEIQHNSIIKSVFNHYDEVDDVKVIRSMNDYLKYMESGLSNLRKISIDPKSVMTEVEKIIRSNSDKVFLSYNGLVFDEPVMRAYAQKYGINLPENIKHLDLLNLVKTVYMDSDDLKRSMHENIRKEHLEFTGDDIGEFVPSQYRKDKLAANRPLIESFERLEKAKSGEKIEGNQALQSDAHNSTVDTDHTAKIAAIASPYIEEEIQKNKTNIEKGYVHHPTHMSWSDEPLKNGQTLFARGGFVAYQDGEESFRMKLDEEGKWNLASNGYNKTVINSKAFYQFAGHQELEKGRVAFRFYDPDKDEYSFVVRKGENAFKELQDFVQSRFYNYEGLSEKERKEIIHTVETDRARRRYESYFSMDSGGKGLTVVDGEIIERGTKGFSGLKRMLENAKILQEHFNSKGEIYREKVRQLAEEAGMSQNEAKKRGRGNLNHADITSEMNFDSLWDPVAKKYIHNEAEERAFFKMHKRLLDEMPFYSQAIEAIDSQYADEINEAARNQNNEERRKKLREINQKRDRALMNYYLQLESDPDIGLPTTSRELREFESRRLSFFDIETKSHRSIDFDTVESARGNLYNYARKSVDTDHPNRQSLMRERMNHLLQTLESQDKISKSQLRYYQDLLFDGGNTVHSVAGAIAIDMRESGFIKTQFDSEIEEVSMTGNEKIRRLTKRKQQEFIERAIRDTQNAELIIRSGAIEGKKIVLGEQLRNTISELDGTRLSGISPNNYKAIETLVSSIHKADPLKHVALTMDGKSKDGIMKVYAYDPVDSIHVQNQLTRGAAPTKALEMTMPLINQAGTHRVGSMILNAHRIAVKEESGKVKLISTAESIARGYAEEMGYIMNLYKEGKRDEAKKAADRTLRSQVEKITGIQRNMSGGKNDTYMWANNISDFRKQTHVKVGNAMVHDMYNIGFRDPNNNLELFKLNENDFYDPEDAFVIKNGEKMLRNDISLEDVKMNAQHRMLMMMPDWAKERIGEDFFTSGLKAEHVIKGTLSTEDVRVWRPYGSFYNQGRDNLIQHENAYLINPETERSIQGLKGISRDPLIKTKKQIELEGKKANQIAMNIKTAYMTNEQLKERIEKLYNSKSGRAILSKADLLTDDGKLDPFKMPRLYEQQGIIAKDVAEILSVSNEKRYEKGSQFIVNQDLELGKTINPGQELGVKIHDNGFREVIRYEGNAPAQVISGIQGDEDLLVQWKSKPFKFMLDGEKMTDTVASRELIKEITGNEDIVAIINPDVSKHKDFGMLMAGEARILSEKVRSIHNKTQEMPEGLQRSAEEERLIKVINSIENGKVGLKWDSEMKGFVDHSFGMKIERDSFKKLFQTLNDQGFDVSRKTKHGFAMGVLEAHMSKVENYSKVIDQTGHQVIGYNEIYNPVTGKYEVKVTHSKRKDGVKWGHREMGVLKSYGLEKTYQYVHSFMIEQAKETGRLDDAFGIADSLKKMTEEHADVQAIPANEFRNLPEQYRNERTFRGTIFDPMAPINAIDRLGKNYQSALSDRGFWLELPTFERSDGIVEKITIQTNQSGSKKELDKIFIPFTYQDEAKGDIHLRTIQQRIANIYKRAAEVDQAEKYEDAMKSFGKLQTAVQGYVKQSFHELSSSKGILFEDVFKTSMGGLHEEGNISSASGLYKLMDYHTSLNLPKEWGDGQFTVISEDMAKRMGVYDQLKKGDELYTANVRYPTFHDGAMQFTKLKMHSAIRSGEIHTTSFMSMLQNADSDGDYSHIVVIDNDKIQKEWKKAHDNLENKYERELLEHKSKVQKVSDPVSIEETISRDPIPGDEEFIPRQTGNSTTETASKIGKMTIGRASNLNLSIRQIADYYFTDDDKMNRMFKKFGQELEQRLIDAKHGAEPVGLKMIDHIYQGEWDAALELDEKYFEGKFQNEFYMKEVAKKMPEAIAGTKGGLHSPGLKFGTSTGISHTHGVQNLVDLLFGNADASDYAGDNKALKMTHEYLQSQGEIDKLPLQKEILQKEPIKPIPVTPMRSRIESGMFDKIHDLSSHVKNMFENFNNMSQIKKAGVIGAALAVGGVASYNIFNAEKPVMHYNDERQESSISSPVIDMPVESDNQNAKISIHASGQKLEQEELSQAVAQGIQETGMKSGPARISIDYQDNTQELNRIWYRDTVRENI